MPDKHMPAFITVLTHRDHRRHSKNFSRGGQVGVVAGVVAGGYAGGCGSCQPALRPVPAQERKVLVLVLVVVLVVSSWQQVHPMPKLLMSECGGKCGPVFFQVGAARLARLTPFGPLA